MAKKKARSSKSARKTVKKTARKASARAGAARKKAARKPAAAKRSPKLVRKKAVRRTRKAVPAARRAAAPPAVKRAAPKAATRPKRPRRTPQALPPPPPPVSPKIDVSRGEPAAEPAQLELVHPPLVEAELVDSGPLAAPPSGPAVGDLAPDFALPDERGQIHRLSDYRGQRLVLYFYPKDDTPGCTAEACGFRDHLGEFTARNAAVLGVSPDSPASHAAFVQKYGLTFPLLADEGHRVAEQYGAWGERVRYGKPSVGLNRTTFLIDPEGRIAHVFRNVHADGHEQEILAKL